MTNDRASTLSIFDASLQDYNAQAVWTDPETGQQMVTGQVFALNSFNFAAQHQQLIARATSYSAGLINYFFRGKLEITEPDQVVMAIIDPNQASGFSKIRFKARNTTPNEDMSGGTLTAVAKYHLNGCYQPDLSGENGVPGIDIIACRSPFEFASVSVPKTGQSFPANGSPQEMTFTFNDPIPAGAMDLYLQVVYRGPLGQEPDAVAVATLDLYEPTHVAFANGTDVTEIYDQYYTFDQIKTGIQNQDPTFNVVDVDGDHVYNTPPDVDVRPQDWTNIPISFTGPGQNPVATIPSLPNGRFARMTVLTARPVLDFYPGSYHFNPYAAVNQVDDTGTILYVTDVQKFKGYYVTNADIVFQCLWWTSCNASLLDIPQSTVQDALVPEAVTSQYP